MIMFAQIAKPCMILNLTNLQTWHVDIPVVLNAISYKQESKLERKVFSVLLIKRSWHYLKTLNLVSE